MFRAQFSADSASECGWPQCMGVNEGSCVVSRTLQAGPPMVLNKHEYGVNSLMSNSTVPFRAL